MMAGILESNHVEFVKLWNDGVKCDEIGKRFGVSKQFVAEYAATHRTECAKRREKNNEKINLEEFAKAWKEGLTAEEIAKKLGVSFSCVSHYAKRHRDICPERERGRRTAVDKEKLARLWKDGLTIEEIAKRLGVSLSCVSHYVEKHRDTCPNRKKGKKTAIDKVEFARLWNSGENVNTMAKKFDISSSYVYHYAKRHRDICLNRKKGRKRSTNHKELSNLTIGN